MNLGTKRFLISVAIAAALTFVLMLAIGTDSPAGNGQVISGNIQPSLTMTIENGSLKVEGNTPFEVVEFNGVRTIVERI